MAETPGQSEIAREIEKQITELEKAADSDALREELERLRQQLEALRQQPSGAPKDAWARVLLARHPRRPHTLDYIQMLFTDFTELHGDRRFAEDPAIVCGFARFASRPVMVVGHQKGRDTKQKLFRNFGMTKPEGYRKALRLMQLAAKFGAPIITLVDTPGAYPGIGAEERGQAEAIAYNLKEIPKLRVPIVVVIHGEGGSGGALAIAVGDKVLMQENAIYSVISPESCSSILWRDWDHKTGGREHSETDRAGSARLWHRGPDRAGTVGWRACRPRPGRGVVAPSSGGEPATTQRPSRRGTASPAVRTPAEPRHLCR